MLHNLKARKQVPDGRVSPLDYTQGRERAASRERPREGGVCGKSCHKGHESTRKEQRALRSGLPSGVRIATLSTGWLAWNNGGWQRVC